MAAATAILTLYALFWLVVLSPFRVNPKRVPVSQASVHRRFSVIVPFRNEKDNIANLIIRLQSGEFGEVFSEIIAVNDHSEDGGEREVEALTDRYPALKFLHLPPGLEGKKEALRLGVEAAKSDWCLLLDADVLPQPGLAAYLKEMALPNAGMVLFPVLPRRGSGVWNALQYWEFVALMQLTRGSNSQGMPVLANGACLAISRNAALEVKGWHPGSASSGDDLALLQHCRRQGLPVIFSELKGPAVRFSPAESGFAMITQRLRWTSKLGAYPDGALFFSAGIIGLANLSVLLWAMAWMAGWASDSFLIPAMKFGTDLLVLLAGSTKSNWREAPWFWLPLTLLLYPVYGSFIACASFWSRPEWKGRKVKLSNAA